MNNGTTPAPAPTTTTTTPWSLAVMLLTRWLENNERVDTLLESLPRDASASTVTGVERARCQNLLYGAIRHKGRVEAHLQKFIARPPRPRLQAVLLVAGFELIDGAKDEPAAANPERSIHPALAIARTARIVHHAVEQTKTLASEPEARLVNAVVRKLAAALAAEFEPPKFAGAGQLASWYSHPEWLVQRWLAQFGATHTRALLEWNQRPASVYARWRGMAHVVAQTAKSASGSAGIPPGRRREAPPNPPSGNLALPAEAQAVTQTAKSAGVEAASRRFSENENESENESGRMPLPLPTQNPPWLSPTPWENFYEVQPGNWPAVEAAIAAGDLYLQDPSTRLAIELLAPRAGERILDACAAPGGKTVAMADWVIRGKVAQTFLSVPGGHENIGTGRNACATLSSTRIGTGKNACATLADGALGERALPSQPAQPAQATRDTLIVALDLPTARIDRLKENLARIPASAEHPDAQRGSGDPRSRPLQVALVEGDLLRADASLFTNGSLPHEYDAVLLDAPCSNTGVMRHRVDVRWRLQPNDFTKHARQQLALLEAAARRVAPGGRLVYSTCSIDAEENERVVETFLKNANARSGGGSDNDGGGRGDGNGKFTMDKSIIARPWDTGHDGAGAFLLRRVA